MRDGGAHHQPRFRRRLGDAGGLKSPSCPHNRDFSQQSRRFVVSRGSAPIWIHGFLFFLLLGPPAAVKLSQSPQSFSYLPGCTFTTPFSYRPSPWTVPSTRSSGCIVGPLRFRASELSPLGVDPKPSPSGIPAGSHRALIRNSAMAQPTSRRLAPRAIPSIRLRVLISRLTFVDGLFCPWAPTPSSAMAQPASCRPGPRTDPNAKSSTSTISGPLDLPLTSTTCLVIAPRCLTSLPTFQPLLLFCSTPSPLTGHAVPPPSPTLHLLRPLISWLHPRGDV